MSAPSGAGASRRPLAVIGALTALGLLAGLGTACSSKSNSAEPKPPSASASSGGGPSSSTGASSSSQPSSKPSASPAPAPRLTSRPGNGASGVSPTAPVGLSVSGGTLSGVNLVGSTGTKVKLTVTADKRRVSVAEPLGYGKTYRWSGHTVGAAGHSFPVRGSFTTVSPGVQLDASLNISTGKQVGIAAPIIVTFGGHVTDRAAAERALTVHTSVPTVGSWAWLPDDGGQSRVHWRPQRYWHPGTKVSVSAKFYGVNYGGGAFGQQDATWRFSVGRSQIVKADVRSHRLLVYRDGRKKFDFPASYGLESDPGRNTHAGIHIVMEKFPVKYMSNPKYGYENLPEKWAVRISNNGEFIHDNDATDGVQGSSNVTHGCINLSYDNALAYFNSVLYGDPVEVTGSPAKLSASDGDIYDWTVPWATWRSMSALAGSGN